MAKTFLVGAEKTDYLKPGSPTEQVYGFAANTDKHGYVVFVERDGTLTPCCDGKVVDLREVRKSSVFRNLWTYTQVNAGRITAHYAKEESKE